MSDQELAAEDTTALFYSERDRFAMKKTDMDSMESIDWSECPLVETKPGVQSGALVLRGTRMPVAAIIANFDYGVTIDEIAEQFELGVPEIDAIISYAQSHRLAHPV